MFGKMLMHSPLLAFPLLALAIFVTVFVAVVVRAARGRSDELARAAALPLTDDEAHHV